jgi:hypothetical protein
MRVDGGAGFCDNISSLLESSDRPMNRTHRLEDLLPSWRQACAEKIAATASSLAAKATDNLPAQVDFSDPLCAPSILRTVSDGTTEFAAAEFLPSGLEWLTGQGLGPAHPARVRGEVNTALRQRLPAFDPFLPPATAQVPYGAWAISAVVGAALGALALAMVTSLALAQREVGLLVGGACGAGLTIVLLAWLSQRPKILKTLQTVAGAATLLTALGGVIKVFRQQSSSLLKQAGWIAGCWLLLLLARPRLSGPTREQCRDALRPQIEELLLHAADLVLALCWSHPDAAGPATAPPAASATMPTALVEVVGALHAVVQDSAASEKVLQTAIRAVLQRVQAEGYEWESVPRGAPYAEELARRFDCFDSTAVGQPVETLEPALLRHGTVLKRGLLRSM